MVAEGSPSPKEAVCQNCGMPFDEAKTFCPKCGLKTGSYLPAEVYVKPAAQGAFSRPSGILAFLSFIFGLFGPLVLGIGWLLGIVLGFYVIHTIRHKGGFIRDRKLAVCGIVFGFVWIILVSIAAGIMSYQKATKAKLKENEKAATSILKENEKMAVSALKDMGLAQRYIKIGCFIDKDKNGLGEYATLNELDKIHQPYLKVKLNPKSYYGYRFTIHEASEISFLADATPGVYGRSGINTFYITHEGFLRGGDIKGESIINTDVILPRLFQGKNIYDDFNEQMAQQLLNLAKRFAYENHDFIRTRAIFAGIKSFFPLSKSLEDLERLSGAVKSLVQEEKAVQLLQDAKILKEEGKDREYLSSLKTIKVNFPRTVIIGEVDKEIGAIDLKFKKQLELEEAKLKKQIEEEANGHIKKIFALDPQKDFNTIATAADLIKKRYPETTIFKQNKEKLSTLVARANFYKFKIEGLEYFRRSDFNQAVIALEKARESYVHADPDIVKALSESYLQEADAYSEERNWEKSLASFQKYFKLKSSLPSVITKRRYTKVCLNMAEDFFRKKDTKKTIEFLDLIKNYSVSPGYAYLRGSIEAAQKKYKGAVDIFDEESLKSIDKTKLDKLLAKKSLCFMALYLEREKELSEFIEKEKIFKETPIKIIFDTSALLQKMFAAEGSVKKAKLSPATQAKINQFRKEQRTISQKILENNAVMDKAVNMTSDIKDYLKNSNIVLSQCGELKDKNYALREYKGSTLRKSALSRKAAERLTNSIVHFKDIQKKCKSILDTSVREFSEERSVERYVRELNFYFQSISIDSLIKQITEAKSLFKKSSEIRMPVPEYLASID